MRLIQIIINDFHNFNGLALWRGLDLLDLDLEQAADLTYFALVRTMDDSEREKFDRELNAVRPKIANKVESTKETVSGQDSKPGGIIWL